MNCRPFLQLYRIALSKMNSSLVVMGVAGCGKTSLAAAVAHGQGRLLIEGDEFHSVASLAKMRQGVPLSDSDREGWLDTLAEKLRAAPAAGVVLSCSALRRAYRVRLRAAAPGVRFVFLDISHANAMARVATRGASHFFSASLVDSQFATLQSPVGEPGVLRLDATAALPRLQAAVATWLQEQQEEQA